MKLMCCISVVFACLCTIKGKIYKAEGVFVVDNEVVKAYMRDLPGNDKPEKQRKNAIAEIRHDIRYIISEVNSLFLKFHAKFQIEIFVRHVQVLNGTEFSDITLRPRTHNVVNAADLKERFVDWLQRNNMYKFVYDFALLWTGFDLYGEYERETTGLANVGRICESSRGTAVVEFDRTYLTALTTAHNIANLLGSYDDNPASQYIMAPQLVQWAEHRWNFSNCTVADIQEYLESSSSPDCLFKTHPDSKNPTPWYTLYKGQMLNVDAICRRATNYSESYMSRSWGFQASTPPNKDRLCAFLLCYVPGPTGYNRVLPSEGMVCDVGKRCKKGECKPDKTAPTTIDSECLHGDQPVVKLSNFSGTCQQYFSKTGAYACYNREVRELCCASCNERRRNNSTVCLYGNQPSPGVPHIYNGSCEKYITLETAHFCYYENITTNCCETCKSFHTGIKGCEYGDKHTNCMTFSREEMCPREDCCYYCHNFVPKVKRTVGLLS